METVIGFIGNALGHDFVVATLTPFGPHALERFHHTLTSCLAAAQWWDRIVPWAVYCIGR